MTWLATLHGDTSHLAAEDAAKLEHAVKDALLGIAGSLTGAGHQGVGATFQGDQTGDVNLLAPGETPDAGDVPSEAAGDPAQVPQLEVTPAELVDAGQVDEQGAPELAPGQALAPTMPEPNADAEQGHPDTLAAGEASEA
jgi:hypothetical protein